MNSQNNKNSVDIRFYAGLNYFLNAEDKNRDIRVLFYGKRSVKDLIESLGVPHVEVELVLVDGISRGFEYILSGGERISAYPRFVDMDIGSVSMIAKGHPCSASFILDVHLGKLARYLRMLGFDVYYDNSIDDPEIARIASLDNRILLTMDRGLLMRSIVKRGLVIRYADPLNQIKQVLDYFELWGDVRPMTRCLECNGAIEKISDGSSEFFEIEKAVPKKVRQWCKEYYICKGCGKVYWRGTHYYDMIKTILEIEEKLSL